MQNPTEVIVLALCRSDTRTCMNNSGLLTTPHTEPGLSLGNLYYELQLAKGEPAP